MAVFWNHDHVSDQTKPNQTSPSGILHFVKHSLRAYQKKFQLSRTYGSWDNGSGKFKFWKTPILGFFEKGPPGAPQKVKNQFWWYFWGLGTHMASQKKFHPFSGPGGIKCVQADWTAPTAKLHNKLGCSLPFPLFINHLVDGIWDARPIFRAKKYNVINKQTDTVALFSGH